MMGLFDTLFGSEEPSYEERMAIYEAQVAQDKRNQEMGDIQEGLDAVSPYMDISRNSMVDPILQNQLDAHKGLAGTRNYAKEGIDGYLNSITDRRQEIVANRKHKYKVDNPTQESANKKLQYANIFSGRDLNDTSPLASDEQRVMFDRAGRAPTWLNQRTQFQEPGSGRTVPINVAEEKTQAEVGKSIGERLMQYKKTRMGNESFLTGLDTHMSGLDYLDDNAEGNTGYMGLASFMPESKARAWAKKLEAVDAQTVIDTMKELKALSPTGSTGFGAVNIRELETMMNKWGVIDQYGELDSIQETIKDRKRIMSHIRAVSQKAQAQDDKWYDNNKGALPESARESVPSGLGDTKNKYGLE